MYIVGVYLAFAYAKECVGHSIPVHDGTRDTEFTQLTVASHSVTGIPMYVHMSCANYKHTHTHTHTLLCVSTMNTLHPHT